MFSHRPARTCVALALSFAVAACDGGNPAVPPGPPAQINATSGQRQISVGARSTDSLRARVVDADGRGVPNVEVRWFSSNETLAAPSPRINVTDREGYAASAVIAGTRTGNVEVSAGVITTAGPSTAKFLLEVVPGPPARVIVSVSGSLLLGVGASRALSAVVEDAGGNTLPGAAVTWATSDRNVAEVTPAGVVSSRGVGSAVITATAGTAQAQINVFVSSTLFVDNFDTENGGRVAFGYGTLSNWTLLAGNVDLIGAGGDYNYFPGNGLYVDLDGAYTGATIQTRSMLTLAPGTYTLRFRLAGSQRGDTNTVVVSLGTLYSESFTLASVAPLTLYSRTITVAQQTSAPLTFAHGGADGFGLILDDVSLARQ